MNLINLVNNQELAGEGERTKDVGGRRKRRRRGIRGEGGNWTIC